MALLELRGLRTSFFIRSGELRVIDGLDFEIDEGEIVGLAGETGSGKSVTAASIIGLVRKPGRVVDGQVLWRGRDLRPLPEQTLEREIRGTEISMIFQNPREALNPVIRVGRQIMQVLQLKRGMSEDEAYAEAVRLLGNVHISDAEQRLRAYPHELSGGMAQRIMIALALSARPRLLIADEPTTGLDVTTQYQIVQLLRELRATTGMAILLITHDLALTADLCDRLAVLYAGRLAEVGPLENLVRTPRHPYTNALLQSRPHLGMTGDIPAIPGTVADLMRPPSGCRFHPRCPNRLAVCSEVQPVLASVPPGQQAACHNPVAVREEVAASGG
jgi:oligopeptide/dipeptide ABC transporter ATP-binding protein